MLVLQLLCLNVTHITCMGQKQLTLNYWSQGEQ